MSTFSPFDFTRHRLPSLEDTIVSRRTQVQAELHLEELFALRRSAVSEVAALDERIADVRRVACPPRECARNYYESKSELNDFHNACAAMRGSGVVEQVTRGIAIECGGSGLVQTLPPGALSPAGLAALDEILGHLSVQS